MLSLNKIFFYKALFGRTRDQREKLFNNWMKIQDIVWNSLARKENLPILNDSFLFFPNKGKVIEKCMSIISPMVNKKLILMYKKSSC